VLDSRIDIQMSRTHNRPLPQGRLSSTHALTFAVVLCVLSMLMLWLLVNPLTAVLTFASLIGYAIIYTVYLKHATPQNIVIGGAAGAAPPVLGWTAVTGEIHSDALLLFLIVFIWTPPHFWALAIARKEDYERVGVPMLPVTHGNEFTRQYILLYTILLVLITILPYLSGLSGLIYLVAALVLGGRFLVYAVRLKKDDGLELPMQVFRFSINYLMILFLALLIDHYYIIRLGV
jgi:protoheme IX farnesyltransferase